MDSLDRRQGLSSEQVAQRVRDGLSNADEGIKTKTEKQIILENTFTFFNILNFVLALFVLLVGSFKNLLFLGVIFSNIIIGSFQGIRAKRTIDKLSLISAPKASVLRDGKLQTIPVSGIVMNDVLHLSTGQQICADAIVLDGEAEVNESLITGESDPVLKRAGDELLSGSFIVSGSCYAEVEHVGRENYANRIANGAKYVKRTNSEILHSLDFIVKTLGFTLVPIGILLFCKQFFLLHDTIREAVVSTVAAILGMIPEGLYLLTSLALVASVIRLANRRTLVHDMGCIETLARVDTLCVDKTGTITEPKMTVDDIVPLQPERYIADDIRMIMADYVCAMQDDNDTMAALRRYFTGQSMQTAIDAMPFRSAKKYGGVSFHEDETYLLGAPEILLANCPEKEQYLPLAEEWSAKGCRVLLLALYDGKLSDEALDAEMMPLALILLSNKIRPEAPQTFAYFAQQGVRTKVISGDNPLTVSEVARRAGIPDAEKFVDARTLKTDAELAKAAEEMTVFGRVTPDQKKKLVAAMKRAGHTVAMTGDGVNDVLALREADCSIAMASGSGVACQASHIVLLDSQFSALPSVVAEGRRVINNIERSASLYLVKNIFTFVLSLITLFFTLPYPYTPAQLSLVNALTIGIPSFILAMEPNENRISGRFLPNVIYRALPAALSDLILVVGVMLFYLAFHIKEDMLSTLCTGIMGIVGLLMVHQTSLPMNKLRKAMLVGLCIAFVVCYFFLPELFTLSALDKPSLLILVVLGLLAFSVMFVCRRGLRKAKARLDKGIFPHRKKR